MLSRVAAPASFRPAIERDTAGFMAALDRGVGVLSQSIDPVTSEMLGDVLRGLTNLALVAAAAALQTGEPPSGR